MKSLYAYLVQEIVVKSPGNNKAIFFPVETPIRVNPDTGVAWIKQYQIELTKDQYRLVH